MHTTRLYELFQPTHYDLHIHLKRRKRRFSGTVLITGIATGASTGISLHAHKLQITSARINSIPAEHSYQPNDVLNLIIPDFIPGEQRIEITFEGDITEQMHGLYPCYFTLDEEPDELLATQFESHHARSVFPCIDEPEAKAIFTLTLHSEPDLTVVSNTPIKQQTRQDEVMVTTFNPTPKMSTYLLAWVVGKLEYVEATTHNGTIVRAYATPDNKDKLTYALTEAVNYINFFNDYFDLPYPLEKCDFIALPDFSAGAMENWGCITFRETALLIDASSSTHAKQYVSTVIAHEIAHQWFGNLVTMKWWNDLWLNESFANFMEYLSPTTMHPEWHMRIQHYQDETTRALKRDALANVQTIQQDVSSPEEIETLFDPAIVYAKGGSLLSMLHDHLDADTFRAGLRSYLSRHQYQNTEADDLWKSLSEASGVDVAAFMKPWITQPGYPVVTVGGSGHTVNLHQRRFFSSPASANTHTQAIWPVPLLSDGQLDENLFDVASSSVQTTSSDHPLLINQGRTGYYLTMYDSENNKKLMRDVQAGSMSVIDRLGLLSDALSLSQAGLQPHTSSLALLEAYRGETSHPVWSVMSHHFHALRVLAGDDDQQLAAVDAFVRTLAKPQLERLGWQPIQGEPYFDTLLRPHIIGLLADAHDTEVVNKLRQMVTEATSPADIWADIRAIALVSAVRFGDDQTFKKLLTWHRITSSAEQRTQLVAGICAVREPQLITQAINMITTNEVKLQDVMHFIGHLFRNRHARDAAWEWLTHNWGWIHDNYAQDFHYTSFVKIPSLVFSTPDQLTAYRKFFTPMLGQVSIARTIEQGIEDIEGRIAWRERDSLAVAEYLHANT